MSWRNHAAAGAMTPALEQKAHKELNEVKENVDAHITAIRRWLKTAKHLEFPDDPELIKIFLRQAKYRNLLAEERIDNFVTIQSSPKYGRPDWIRILPVDHPILAKYRTSHIHIPIGFLPESGVFVLIARLGSFDPDVFTPRELTTCIHMMTMYLLTIPSYQINGVSFIADMTGVSMKTLKSFQNIEDGKFNTKYFQESLPVRLKHIIYYNAPSAFDVIFKVFEGFLNPKIRERVHFCRDNFDKVKKILPGLDDILPKEYGGKVDATADEISEGSFDQMIEYYKKNPAKKMNVDDSKRVSKTKLENFDTTGEMKGSYVRTGGDIF